MRSTAHNPHKSDFSKLLEELDGGDYIPKLHAIKLHAQARGNNRAGEEFRKSLAAITEEAAAALAPKPRRTFFFVSKAQPPAGAEIIAKAFHALKHGDLNADQRGRLMLALGNVADRVFAKAMPSGAERVEPQSARALAAKIKEIEGFLDRHATASHVAEAERILASVQETLAHSEEGMSMGDHGVLRIQLSDLKHLIESKKHVQG